VVLVVKSEENAETAFGFNLHAQNITIKCLDGFQVVHFQDHMSYSFNWHHHFHKYGYEAVLRAEVAKDSGSLRAGVVVVTFDPQLTKVGGPNVSKFEVITSVELRRDENRRCLRQQSRRIPRIRFTSGIYSDSGG
jgi:hypothetical protein